jgi:ankyrin repeat protein
VCLSVVSSASVTAAGDARVADAVMRQDRQASRALLAGGAGVDAPQADGATALHWAAHWDDLETVNLLLGRGARVNAATDLGVTPLMLACENGSAAVVTRLLDAGADPNLTPGGGETSLMIAARTGNVAGVNALLAHGARVNDQQSSGQTALMWAVAQRHADVVHALIAGGADVHARSKSGFSPLLFAARQGDLESARALVTAGADVNERMSDGTSVLLVATASGQEPLVLWLLDRHADPNLADTIGYAPLHAAIWKQSAKPELLTVKPASLEVIAALVKHGADPDLQLVRDPPALPGSFAFVTGLAGGTAFWLAARAGDVAVMRLLAGAGANTQLPNADGTTPLMVAAGVGQRDGPGGLSQKSALEAVMLAVELGADVNAVNGNGQTALHGAAGIGWDSVLRVLAQHGANVNTRDKRGLTPLALASRRNASHPTTIELLRTLGAQADK